MAFGLCNCAAPQAPAWARPEVDPVSAIAPYTEPVQVAIVGAGVAGLVAGYELERQGYSTHLLESSATAGGRLATMRYGQGLHAESGMQEIWEGNPLLDVAQALGVPLDEPGEAYSSVLIGGVVYPYVQESLDEYLRATFDAEELQSFRSFNETAARLHGAARREGLGSTEVAHLQQLSFEHWIRDLKLPFKVAEFVRLSIECELGADWSQFSAISGILEYEIFLGQGKRFWHVRDGNLRLVEAVIRHRHGPTTTGALVTRVERQGQGAEHRFRVYFSRDHVQYALQADRVVIAVPFTHLAQIQFVPALTAQFWSAVRSLSFGEYVVVHFEVDRAAEALWQKDGVAVPTLLTSGPLGVVYGETEPAPAAAETTIFTLLIHGGPARAWHTVPREVKLAEARAGLDRLFPGLAAHIRGEHAYAYHPAAIPVWPPGRSPLDAGAEELRRDHDGLYFAGDYTEGAHSDGAARSAVRAAGQIASSLPRPQPAQTTGAEASSRFPKMTRSSDGP